MEEVISVYRRFYLKLLLAVIGMEMILRVATFGLSNDDGLLTVNLLMIVLFSAAWAAALWLLRWLIPGKVGKVLFLVVLWAMVVVYMAQVVYFDIFRTFYTTYSMLNGAQVAEFQRIIWSTIFRELLPILLLAGIGALLSWQGNQVERPAGRLSQKSNDIVNLLAASKQGLGSRSARREMLMKGTAVCLCGALLCCVVSVAVGTWFPVSTENRKAGPAQYLHRENEIKGMVKSFGLQTATILDVSRLIFGFVPALETAGLSPANGDTYSEKTYNVLKGLDFAAMATQAEEAGDDELADLHRWLGSRTPSKKNAKTGLFAGKNLILITAESFTDFAISQKYTPTLYQLQQEGFQFTNFYNPIWGVSTIDGEYVNTQSLIPETGVWSMKVSRNHALPFTLGNQMAAEGYVTKAYHNHSIYFYDRNLSHPNLGYDFDGQDGSFHFEKTWPESDLEMMEKTVPDFLKAAKNGNAPFHVYYLTVSGHRDYTFDGDAMAEKHEEAVKDLPLSAPCRAYLAANMELDLAMKSLLAQLRAADVLDDTVIVLAGDHYPYGLTSEEIGEFKGHAVDEEYEIYESTLLLWTPGMKAERVDKVCSNMDILPTLSNLFGLDYDSRLMMGTDIFSDSPGLVVFANQDWRTDETTRRDSLKTPKAAQMDQQVEAMFAASTRILETDYYCSLSVK